MSTNNFGIDLQQKLIEAGIPVNIWHKRWNERFSLMSDGNVVGYANLGGWYIKDETFHGFIEQYSILKNRGIVKPCI